MTALDGGLASTTGAGGTFNIVSGAGYPTGVHPFVVVINRGEATEEKILCSARSSNTLTIQERGYDDTTAQSHVSGVTVHHGLDAQSMTDVNAHAFDATRDDHGQYLTAARRGFVTVAPSDASADVKAGANYVCDGTADDVQVQAAINAHPYVRLLSGNFYFAAKVTVTGKLLEGEGTTTIINVPNGANITPLQGGGAGWCIRDLKIEGNGTNQTVNSQGLTASGTLWNIENVHVYNAHYIGIHVAGGSQRWTIDRCVIDTTVNFYGLAIYGDGTSVTQHGRVTNCFARATSKGGIGIQGFASYITFANNHTKDTVEDGVTGYNAANRYISFVNNVMENPGNHGTHIGGNHIKYIGNVVISPMHSACYARNHDNTVMYNVTMSDNQSIGNESATTGHGFYVFGVDTVVLADNLVQGAGAHGILVVDTVKYTVSGNVIKGANNGIRLQGASRGAVTGNVVNQTSSHGIHLLANGTTNALYNTVTGNHVSEASGNFIIEGSGSNYNVIVANTGVTNTSPLSTSGAGTVAANNVDV